MRTPLSEQRANAARHRSREGDSRPNDGRTHVKKSTRNILLNLLAAEVGDLQGSLRIYQQEIERVERVLADSHVELAALHNDPIRAKLAEVSAAHNVQREELAAANTEIKRLQQSILGDPFDGEAAEPVRHGGGFDCGCEDVEEHHEAVNNDCLAVMRDAAMECADILAKDDRAEVGALLVAAFRADA